MTCPTVVDICSWLRSRTRARSTGTWSAFSHHRLARRVPGRSFFLADLLSGDLVVPPCSVDTWSFVSPCRLVRWGLGYPALLAGTWSVVLPPRLARRRLGWSFRLTDLLGGYLVVPHCWPCVVGTWLTVLPRRLARQGLGRPTLLPLPGGYIVNRAYNKDYRLTLGTPFFGYPTIILFRSLQYSKILQIYFWLYSQ